MSQALIDKINKAREQIISLDGFDFTIRRPNDLEVYELRGKGARQADLLGKYVLNWDGVKEMDLIPGGTPKPVPFDTALFIAWVGDRPQIFLPLTERIVEAYQQHEAELAEALKKPVTG